MTQRRMMIAAARQRVEVKVAAAITPVLRRQGNALERYLRKPTLRKRLAKITVPKNQPWAKINLGNGYTYNALSEATSASIYRVQTFLKQGGFPPDPDPNQQPEPQQDKQGWDAWKTAFVAALGAALLGGVDDIGDTENEIWTSRGYNSLIYDPQTILDDYQDRTGRDLGDIADSTMGSVEKLITDWYTGDEPFASLTDSLDSLFGEDRAGVIARQETGDITSQIFIALMGGYSFADWIWDAILDSRTCAFCTDMHGRRFHLGDPMPPDAAHVECRCGATPVLPEEE